MHPTTLGLAPDRPAVATPQPPDPTFGKLIPALRRAVADEGYTTPTPIQAQAIPPLLDGRDLLGSAQTGTGKTAAFVLPMLQRLNQTPGRPQPKRPRALILAPTRELAAQIGDSIRAYGRHLRHSFFTIYGGVGYGPQIRALSRGVDIVVATPGRLLDLVEQKAVCFDRVEMFVLDEVDRMLDMGFIRDIRKVVASLPAKRQSLFFSATMPPEAEALARDLVRDPVRIAIAPETPTVEKIAQKVLFVGRQNKHSLLLDVLKGPGTDRVIVFTQMKHAANKVVDKLEAGGVRSEAIHGNKSQAARTRALDAFRRGRIRVLVATDVAARGIDVDGITHVVNYDLPIEAETYVHRIGRTARAGSAGAAISFCSAEERDFLRDIERLIRKPVPTELDHAYHCDLAQHAVGSAAKPPPRGGYKGRNGGGGGGGGRGRSPAGARSSGGPTSYRSRGRPGAARVRWR